MVLAGTVFHRLGHVHAAAIVWALAAFFLALALISASVYETSQTLVTHAASRVTTVLGLAALVLVYALVFVPGRLLLRLRGRDPMNRRFPSAGKTNWNTRVDFGAEPRLYTRQYTRPHAAPAEPQR